jgi:hypothetical protein
MQVTKTTIFLHENPDLEIRATARWLANITGRVYAVPVQVWCRPEEDLTLGVYQANMVALTSWWNAKDTYVAGRVTAYLMGYQDRVKCGALTFELAGQLYQVSPQENTVEVPSLNIA